MTGNMTGTLLGLFTGLTLTAGYLTAAFTDQFVIVLAAALFILLLLGATLFWLPRFTLAAAAPLALLSPLAIYPCLITGHYGTLAAAALFTLITAVIAITTYAFHGGHNG